MIKTPTIIQQWINHKWSFFTGFCFLSLGVFLLLALTSFHSADPSFNRSSDGMVLNWAGSAGAYIADPLLQLFGLASIILAITACCWGYIILRANHLSLWWARLAALLTAIPAIAGSLALLTTIETWPFQTYGGIMGSFVHDELIYLGSATLFASVFPPIAILCFAYCLGFSWQEWKSGLFAIGWLGQKLYSSLRIISAKLYHGCHFLYYFVTRNKEAQAAQLASQAYQNRVEFAKEPPKPKRKRRVSKQASLKLSPEDDYEFPDVEMLKAPPTKRASAELTESALSQNARMLEKVLEDFGVQGQIIKIRPGPVVTLYELEPAAGIKSSRVIGLADDISRSMSAISTRIAVIPGRNVIGIELPNANRETVYLREILDDDHFKDNKLSLPLALGKEIGGDPIIVDLAKMPHLLVAGTTGSGKSVAINAMILSFLYRLSPDECKFIMIDPKMLELSVYDGIPHLLTPVVTEPGKAVTSLKWVTREMENRYRLMSNLGVRNISSYNKRLKTALQKGEVLERTVQTGFDPDTGKPIVEKVPLDMSPLPFIVVVVDEMADLMLTAGKEIENSIQRLAQMARAAGIHLIMATQRPSVDVITGVIKANFPTRISFQVTSRIDSRTILGEQGAEQLLGMGDMLYMAGGSRITRIHGPYVDDGEVERIVSYLKSQGQPHYIDEVTEDTEGAFTESGGMNADSGDALYDQAVALVTRENKVSISYVQRQLRIGYNRAATIVERMEAEGVVSTASPTGKRTVLVE